MTMLTNYAVNKTVDALFRAQSLGAPATLYHSLIVATQGYWTASTPYTTGQLVLPVGGNGRIYKCTTAGTSSSSAPTWPTTAGGTVTDGGTLVWTEQTTAMLAGTFVEASYTGFARVAVTASLANYAGTQSAGSTVASSGTSGQTSNNGTITFGAPTSSQAGVVFGVLIADASSSGNIWAWSALTNPKTINNGDAAPNFPAAALTLTFS
jgi:hypothetical protein